MIHKLFSQKPNIDWIGWRWLPISCSFIILFGGLTVVLTKGFNYSIEFEGGAVLQVTFEKPLGLNDVRKALDKKNLHPEIQSAVGKPTFILRQKGTEESVKTLTGEMETALKTDIPDNAFSVDRREYIGPTVGQALKIKTMWAIVLSLLGIIIYVGFRFSNPIWGLAGLIALFHDVIGTAAMISLTGKEMDILIVSALLTIAGYSIEDTIIIYDRMREMNRVMYKEPLQKIIDTAINDTLSRTVITVLLVQIICVVLYLAGGEVLHNFAAALVVGNFLGSYSSIAVAAPLVYEWEVRRKRPVTPVALAKPGANNKPQGPNNKPPQQGKTAGVRRP